jgi:uncharacterized protein (TIGR02246 family)
MNGRASRTGRVLALVRHFLVFLALLWLPSSGVVHSEAAAPEALVDVFVRAWNAHDMGDFGKVIADDADWVTVNGTRYQGRAAIQGALEREHTTWAATTTIRTAQVKVRASGPDTSVILFDWEITGAVDREGKAAGPSQGTNLLVTARRPQGWAVVTGQATRANR